MARNGRAQITVVSDWAYLNEIPGHFLMKYKCQESIAEYLISFPD